MPPKENKNNPIMCDKVKQIRVKKANGISEKRDSRAMKGRRASVALRFKPCKNGRRSVYLDIYSCGVRKYEFLNLYLTGGKDWASREADRAVMETAEALRSRREDDLRAVGVPAYVKAARAEATDFSEWVRYVGTCKTGKTTQTYNCAARAVALFDPDSRLGEIGAEWLDDFAEWLQGSGLAPMTARLYHKTAIAALREAERRGLVLPGALHGVSPIKAEQAQRCYLSIEELQRMAATPERNDKVRRAFLFSCLTGLRLSDVRSLLWGQVQTLNGATRLVFRQKKTGGQMWLDISANAVPYMGQRGADADKVFAGLTAKPGRFIKNWAARAGITKWVTFHTARHTFAVLMLTLGVDIYTVSKMLGHKDLKTTQIYADIVDARRRAAVDLIPRLPGAIM